MRCNDTRTTSDEGEVEKNAFTFMPIVSDSAGGDSFLELKVCCSESVLNRLGSEQSRDSGSSIMPFCTSV